MGFGGVFDTGKGKGKKRIAIPIPPISGEKEEKLSSVICTVRLSKMKAECNTIPFGHYSLD